MKKTTPIIIILILIIMLTIIYQPNYSKQNSGIKGLVLLGPHCPVVIEGQDCPDTPFKTNLVITIPGSNRIIKTFNSNTDGTFIVQLKPGNYEIKSGAAANILPYCFSGPIEVQANAYTNITVHCDTGIR